MSSEMFFNHPQFCFPKLASSKCRCSWDENAFLRVEGFAFKTVEEKVFLEKRPRVTPCPAQWLGGRG
jgi:hypothetical protein